MSVKELLIDTLENAFGFPIYLQGSMSEDEKYPDDFFTFFNNDSFDANFFDDHETVTVWDFDLNFYSNDPEHVNEYLMKAKRELKKVGFTCDGAGYDLVSDEPTHTGRGININYIEKVRY